MVGADQTGGELGRATDQANLYPFLGPNHLCFIDTGEPTA